MGATTLSVMSIRLMPFSITTLSVKGLFATLSITNLCHYAEYSYAECRVLFVVIMSDVMLNVAILGFVILSVIVPF